MYAYCWATGRIGFGRSVPNGALPIARGRSKRLRDLIEGTSRHAYDGTTLLVPGVPEAPDQARGLDALEAFIGWLRRHPTAGVEVFTRGHRWPIDGKPSRRTRRTFPLGRDAILV